MILAITSILFPVALWVMFIACVNFIRLEPTMAWYTKAVAACVVLVGVLMDFLFNVTYMR